MVRSSTMANILTFQWVSSLVIESWVAGVVEFYSLVSGDPRTNFLARCTALTNASILGLIALEMQQSPTPRPCICWAGKAGQPNCAVCLSAHMLSKVYALGSRPNSNIYTAWEAQEHTLAAIVRFRLGHNATNIHPAPLLCVT